MHSVLRKHVHSCSCFSSPGVDFQTKVLDVDGRVIALQLWDTAGQERWVHVFTKKRIMTLFSNQWKHTIQEGLEHWLHLLVSVCQI